MKNKIKHYIAFEPVFSACQLQDIPRYYMILAFEMNQGLNADKIVLSDSSTIIFQHHRLLFSFMLNNKMHNSGEINAETANGLFLQTFENIIRVDIQDIGPV